MSPRTLTPEMLEAARNPATSATELADLAQAVSEMGGDDFEEEMRQRLRLYELRYAVLGNPQTPPQSIRWLLLHGYSQSSGEGDWTGLVTKALDAVAHNPAIELMLLMEPGLLKDLRDYSGDGITIWYGAAVHHMSLAGGFVADELAVLRAALPPSLHAAVRESEGAQASLRSREDVFNSFPPLVSKAFGVEDADALGATNLLLFDRLWQALRASPVFRLNIADKLFTPLSPALRRLAILHGAHEL